MEIKPCPFCGGKIEVRQRGTAIVRYFAKCVLCSIETEANYMRPEDAADVVNQRFEQNPSEADKWLKEAEYQRTRADLLTMQRDQLTETIAEYDEALQQARRMLAYAGKLQ